MRNKAFLIVAVLMMLPVGLRAQWRVGVIEGAVYNIHSQDVHYMTDFSLNGALKNYKMSRTDLNNVDYNYLNNYLLIPVMASFSFGGDNFPLRGFANLGYYGGLWLTSHRFGTDYNVMSEKTYEFAGPVAFNQERDNRLDMGLVGGVGMELRCNKHLGVQIEARCYYSLTSQVKEYMKVKDYRYDTTIGLQAGVYYIF